MGVSWIQRRRRRKQQQEDRVGDSTTTKNALHPTSRLVDLSNSINDNGKSSLQQEDTKNTKNVSTTATSSGKQSSSMLRDLRQSMQQAAQKHLAKKKKTKRRQQTTSKNIQRKQQAEDDGLTALLAPSSTSTASGWGDYGALMMHQRQQQQQVEATTTSSAYVDHAGGVKDDLLANSYLPTPEKKQQQSLFNAASPGKYSPKKSLFRNDSFTEWDEQQQQQQNSLPPNLLLDWRMGDDADAPDWGDVLDWEDVRSSPTRTRPLETTPPQSILHPSSPLAKHLFVDSSNEDDKGDGANTDDKNETETQTGQDSNASPLPSNDRPDTKTTAVVESSPHSNNALAMESSSKGDKATVQPPPFVEEENSNSRNIDHEADSSHSTNDQQQQQQPEEESTNVASSATSLLQELAFESSPVGETNNDTGDYDDVDTSTRKSVRFADADGLPLEEEIELKDDHHVLGRVVILLLSPEHRQFEFLQTEYAYYSQTTVKDLLEQLPGLATNILFQRQVYTGLCRVVNKNVQELINSLTLRDCGMDKNEVVIAIAPPHTANELAACGMPLLANAKIARAVKHARRSGRALKFIHDSAEWARIQKAEQQQQEKESAVSPESVEDTDRADEREIGMAKTDNESGRDDNTMDTVEARNSTTPGDNVNESKDSADNHIVADARLEPSDHSEDLDEFEDAIQASLNDMPPSSSEPKKQSTSNPLAVIFGNEESQEKKDDNMVKLLHTGLMATFGVFLSLKGQTQHIKKEKQ